MYERAALSRRSHEDENQVGARGLYRGHVLVCDDIYRDDLRSSIYLLR